MEHSLSDRTAEHCCICIPRRACVERLLTCVRPTNYFNDLWTSTSILSAYHFIHGLVRATCPMAEHKMHHVSVALSTIWSLPILSCVCA